ncbi:unnamed protein product [Chironomus riparius]|uniref:Cytochrome P450 n=1 Tax=Chironomus riparius TaxID=315576 RepID=A0A9N9WW93_9DIPT|nr:unnamed protein product [Chironomus riparius]
MWTVLILILSAAYLFYKWYTQKYDYFETRGIPYIKAKFPLGNLPNAILFMRNFLYDFDDIYQQFRGKESLVGYFETRSPQFLILSPDIAKKILTTHFASFHDNEFSNLFTVEMEPVMARNPFILKGQEWKEKRAEITPAFTSSRLRACFPLIEEVLIKFTKYIRDEFEKDNNKIFDVRNICHRFTVDAVSSCIFNADAQSFASEKPEIAEMGRKLVEFHGIIQFIQFMLISMFPNIRKYFKMPMVDKVAENFFINLMQQAVELRETNPIPREDFMSFLIELKKKKSISEIEMAAHGVTFFTDGTETSSLAIAHILYELADNKKAQGKLRKEINDKIIDENGKIIFDKMLDSEYLNQVFYESLRLHEPIGIYNRQCNEETVLDCGNGKRYKVEKGMSVNIPIHSIHRDPDYYLNPNEFIPERFDPENGGPKAFEDRGVLLPFGDGPRICLGRRFAVIQVKAAVVEIIRNFEMSVNEKTQRPLIIDTSTFLNAKKGGLWLNIQPIV